VFYVGHIDKSSLYETLFHCNILSKYYHHHVSGLESKIVRVLTIISTEHKKPIVDQSTLIVEEARSALCKVLEAMY
jgi:hypothetical protein